MNEHPEHDDRTVLVAMSGGVDSSLAAALLLEQGYRVTGVTLHLWRGEPSWQPRQSACCSLDAAENARRVCQKLGIPHYVLNVADAFLSRVVEPFVREYARGRTPNPCIACNREIKFRLLLERARALGFRYLATGHYARIVCERQGSRTQWHLLRGVDPQKDQSYVLYMLGQQEIQHLLFPLGEFRKQEVRREAARRGLPTAGRAESQEICFIADGDYRAFLSRQDREIVRPGPIRDLSGKLLGVHRGLAFYTVGQRKGLGVSGQPRPLFVVALDPAENALIVGPEEALYARGLEAEGVSFVSGDWPGEPLRVSAQVRYRSPAVPATLAPAGRAEVRLEFDVPQRAITPGQAVVFYRGEEVLGGGTIRTAIR
ncbi:MAG: tRNA 2-thiouridine(34) synthase MnmA [Chloroflexia bacterium]